MASRILLGLLVGNFVFGQTPEAGSFTLSAKVDLVMLDIDVRDVQGHFASGLQPSDFTVFDDGHKVEIRSFNSFDTPVTIGLVVDNSGSMAEKRVEVINAGLAFARESTRGDHFFVVNFNDSVTRGLPPSVSFTDNLQMLKRALYFGAAGGQTALYDAVAYSLKHLELSTAQRRSLIVVTDGRDNVSGVRFGDLMKAVESSRATIYTIGLRDPAVVDGLNPGVLRRIAHVSGGEYFEPKQASDIAPIFHQVSEDIRHRYTIGYIPDETNDRHVFRTIKVTARSDNRKLKVRTRTVYSIAPLVPSASDHSLAEVH